MIRILGVDLGTVRTGVAVGSFGVARPLTVLESRDDEDVVRQLTRHAREQDVREIVLGLALSLDGTDGPAAVRQRFVAEQLREATGLLVHLWDERLTTAEAERVLIGAGMRRERRRAEVDKVAATLMLQSYLDARSSKGAGA